MFAFAVDNFLDFFQRTGIDENSTCGDRFAAEGAIFVEFDAMTVLEEKNFAGDCADLMRERRVAEEMAKFAVNGNEIFWFYQLQQKFLLFLAGVTRNVDDAGGVVVIDERAASKHVIEHAEDGFFVSWNNARRKDHGVVLVD